MKFSNIFFNSAAFEKNNNNLDFSELIKKAAFFNQESSGIYSTLSLGFILESKVNSIITEELSKIDFSQIRLSNIQDSELWKESERYNQYGDELFKLKNRKGSEFVLGATCEEQITQLVKNYYNFKQTDLRLFQIGNKYRDELRTKYALIRAKEFLMADAYHFSNDFYVIKDVYQLVKQSYINIFNRLGIDFEIVKSDVGEMGGLYSEEFRCKSSFGEDKIDNETYLEIAHIFNLGTHYSKKFNLLSNSGDVVNMSCFGIGVSRLIMALLEKHRDDKGFFGDNNFNTFDIILTVIDYEKIKEQADYIYNILKQNGFSVLLDDRKISSGKKFNDSELIAVNERIIISQRAIDDDNFEILKRSDSSKRFIKQIDLINYKK